MAESLTAVPSFAIQHLRKRSECPVCLSGLNRKEIAFDGFEVSKCLSCGLRFQTTYLDDEWMDQINRSRELSQLYFPECAHYFELRDRAKYVKSMSKRWNDWLSFIEPAASGRRLIDIGCGTGDFLNFAKKRGWTTEGVEYDPELGQKARDHYGLPVQIAEFGEWTKPVGAFDLITIFDVVEHFVNPVSVIEMCHTMLRPQGWLMIAVPNDRSLLAILARTLFKSSKGRIQKPVRLLYEFDHRSFFSPSSLSRLVRKTGFSVERVALDETNLERLDLDPVSKSAVLGVFFAARFLALQNRLVLFAKKGNVE